MSSKEVGIETARKTLGDLATAAQYGHTTILTRNGKPIARIAPLETAMATPQIHQPIQFDHSEVSMLLEALNGHHESLMGKMKGTDDLDMKLTYRDQIKRFSAISSRIAMLAYQDDPTEPGHDENA